MLSSEAMSLILGHRASWHAICKLAGVFALQTISPIEPAVRAKAPAGPVYCFVPAGGTDGARTQSRNAIRQVSEAMRACLTAEGDCRTHLLADFLDETTSCIKCVDLNQSDPGQAREAISVAEAVFVVCASDGASIENARAQAPGCSTHSALFTGKKRAGYSSCPSPGVFERLR
jgi:hypothetical protein